jgi:hypothetical protein
VTLDQFGERGLVAACGETPQKLGVTPRGEILVADHKADAADHRLQ